MITTIITSAITAIITGLVIFMVQERKLKTELRTEFMAEQVAKELLENENWKKRSFIRAGAVRFESKDGAELWGLISKNKKDI